MFVNSHLYHNAIELHNPWSYIYTILSLKLQSVIIVLFQKEVHEGSFLCCWVIGLNFTKQNYTKQILRWICCLKGDSRREFSRLWSKLNFKTFSLVFPIYFFIMQRLKIHWHFSHDDVVSFHEIKGLLEIQAEFWVCFSLLLRILKTIIQFQQGKMVAK